MAEKKPYKKANPKRNYRNYSERDIWETAVSEGPESDAFEELRKQAEDAGGGAVHGGAAWLGQRLVRQHLRGGPKRLTGIGLLTLPLSMAGGSAANVSYGRHQRAKSGLPDAPPPKRRK